MVSFYACHQIEIEPALVLIDTPDPGPLGYKALADAAELINASEHWFDGKVLMTGTSSDAGQIQVFEAWYRWAVAYPSAAISCHTDGLMAVGLVLQNASGDILWQQRSDTTFDAGMWSLSAAGALDPGRGLREMILLEAHQELGIEPQILEPKIKVFALLSRPGIGACVLYTARIDDAETFLIPNEEVRDLFWAPVPDPPTGLDQTSRLALPLLRQSLLTQP